MTDRLEQLASLPPQTKAGKIRAFMPEIERRLADGVTRQAIIDWLAEGGIVVTPATFKSYLQRYREGNRSQPQPALSNPSPSPTPITRTPPVQPNTDRNTGTDPEPIMDGNSDREIPTPEPDPELGQSPKLADILDATKGDALTDQYMKRRKPIIGKNRSEK